MVEVNVGVESAAAHRVEVADDFREEASDRAEAASGCGGAASGFAEAKNVSANVTTSCARRSVTRKSYERKALADVARCGAPSKSTSVCVWAPCFDGGPQWNTSPPTRTRTQSQTTTKLTQGVCCVGEGQR